MNIRYTLSLFITLLLAGASSAIAQTEANYAKLDSLFDQLDAHHKVMCSVLFAKDGNMVYHREIGFANSTPKQASPTLETEYRIGSISKMFAASIIFQLIEEKKLSLDTKLSKFFPQIPNADSITIEEMLSHRSGIYDFTRDSNFSNWANKLKKESELVDTIASGAPAFAPGAKGDYSNSNYLLLGYIIEKITGKPYAKVLAQRITKKLGLKHTYYGGRIGTKPNEAHSFMWDEGEWIPGSEWNISVAGAAGGLVSTTTDLMKFIDALFKGKIVSDSSLAVMKTMKDHFGHGMFKSPFHSRWSYGHNGRIDNFLSDLGYFPDDSTEMVFLSNGLNYDGNSILIAMLSIYYGLPYTIPTFKEIRIDTALFPQYVGTYGSKTLPIKITVQVEEGKLTAMATGQSSFPISPTDVDQFQFEDAGIIIKFHRNESKTIDALNLIQSGSNLKFEKE